jgi:hypothetical protein
MTGERIQEVLLEGERVLKTLLRDEKAQKIRISQRILQKTEEIRGEKYRHNQYCKKVRRQEILLMRPYKKYCRKLCKSTWSDRKNTLYVGQKILKAKSTYSKFLLICETSTGNHVHRDEKVHSEFC